MRVEGAHYIISRRGPDTDLKRWGLHLAESGGKRGKKKAVVAIARKLGILPENRRAARPKHVLDTRRPSHGSSP